MAVRSINDAKPKKKKLRKAHYLWIMLVAGTAIFVIASIAQNYIEYRQIKSEVSAVNAEIAALDKESEEIEKILSDDDHSDYFEKIAREEYGYCKPGEKVYYNSSFGE